MQAFLLLRKWKFFDVSNEALYQKESLQTENSTDFINDYRILLGQSMSFELFGLLRLTFVSQTVQRSVCFLKFIELRCRVL